MRIKLPENFGGISGADGPIVFKPDVDGCVDVEDGLAQTLLSHGGIVAPAVEEKNAEVDAELEENDKQRALIASKKQRGGRPVAPAEDEVKAKSRDEG